MTRPRLVAGIMSGTSVDAIDVALVRLDADDEPSLAHAAEWPFDDRLRTRTLAAGEAGGGSTAEIARLDAELAHGYALAIRETLAEAAIDERDLDLVGCHGQTVAHRPDASPGTTLQLGSGTALAALLGVPVVHDFRAADVALGGQGAPLIPFVDFLLLRETARSRPVAALNIGGIANLTLLPQGTDDPVDLIAFDSGPGNMVIDALADWLLGERYDRDGAVAAAGVVDDELLAELLADPYFARPAPRSAGREQFGREFARTLAERGQARALATADLLATATALTVRSIAHAVDAVPASHRPETLVVAGGGARNGTLMRMLRDALTDTELLPMEALGWPADGKEAVGFALLADAAVRGIPTGLPNVTGTREPLVLGAIAPGRPPRIWPDWIAR